MGRVGRITLAVVIVLGLAAVALTACNVVNPPKPEIVGQTARDGSPDFDYTIYVQCTVRNNGGDGQIEVVATLSGGGSWTKRQSVHVSSDQERMVTLTFPEPEFLSAGLGGYRYGCSATAK